MTRKAGWKKAVGNLLVLQLLGAFCEVGRGQTFAPKIATAEKVIIDTDIGDDIDDAFALVLALSSHRIQILGVTTAYGDTDVRAREVERILTETGHEGIPVAAGPKTDPHAVLTQAHWAEGFPEPRKGWPDAVSFILEAIRRNPGEITLISLAPLTNVGALIEKDPITFRKLKRVVMMGGSVRRGYGGESVSAEYNIKMDIPAAKELFAAGVAIDLMPLDSTQLRMEEGLRSALFGQGTAATNVLQELYRQWASFQSNPTPVLYDAMAVGAVLEPKLCPTTPMRLRVDDAGYTRIEKGPPNADVCLHSDADTFFEFYQRQVRGQAAE